MDPVDNATPAGEKFLELAQGGTRFARGEDEGEFLIWRATASASHNRYGMSLAIATWLLVLSIGLATHGGGVAPWAAAIFGLHYPSMLATYFVTRQPRRIPRYGAVVMLPLLISSVLSVAIYHWLFRLRGEMIAAFGISAFFSLVIARVRTVFAATAVAPSFGLTVVVLVGAHRAGEIDTVTTTIDLLLVVITFATGVVMSVANERTSRIAYRQERVIEAQRATIAAERERSEGLLRQELAHQVAERSRELGHLLVHAGATSVPLRPVVGDRIDARYRIERELGSGGMGAVYEVSRLTDGERLALKVVTGEVSRERAGRFAREAEIGARVRHPNVISIVDIGIANGAPFLVMELAPRGSLEERRDRFGDEAWARSILAEIAAGLAALHDAGIVHRDLKPANVLLTGDDAALVAKISDFGISRFGTRDAYPDIDPTGSTMSGEITAAGVASARPMLTAAGMVLGTPFYMAPEAAQGGAMVGAAADVFAFGILACELLVDTSPFLRPPLLTALDGEPLGAPLGLDDARVDARLRATIEACLAEDPSKRPSMRAICGALGRP